MRSGTRLSLRARAQPKLAIDGLSNRPLTAQIASEEPEQPLLRLFCPLPNNQLEPIRAVRAQHQDTVLRNAETRYCAEVKA